MPLSFGLIYQLLVIVAIALVVVPLVRAGADRRWQSALVAGLVLYFGSAIGYGVLSDWPWPEGGAVRPAATAPPAGGVDIDALRERARAAPDTPQPWAMLGAALLSAGRAPEAVPALERAQQLTGNANPDVTLLLVDALMAADDSTRPRVNQMVEDVLRSAPDHPKALMYGAELAFSRREFQSARDRWQQLLDRATQEDNDQARQVTGILRNRIELADQHLGSGGAGAAAALPEPSSPPATADGLDLEILLDPALAGDAEAGEPLFVLAREPGGGGPPIAVVRRAVGELPLRITLSDRDAMLANRVLSGFDRVEVVARIARSGTPVAASGDLFGNVVVDTDGGGTIRIVIDEVYP